MPSTMWDAPIRSTCHAFGVAGVACAGLTLFNAMDASRLGRSHQCRLAIEDMDLEDYH